MTTSHVLTMRRTRHIHFVGVGGAGMSGIAEVLLTQGYVVSGSDLNENNATQRLTQLGASIMIGHRAENIQGADVVVISSAVPTHNPEVNAAQQALIPIVPRAEMLGELMRFRYGIAIAGTHGKTTTTSLVTSIFAEAGLDPTFIIGGLLNSVGCNARLGNGRYLVAEADESDASFLHLQPMVTVVTNIDRDHMATYHNDFSLLCDTFVSFIQRLPFYGLVVVCIDNPTIRELLPRLQRPVITYGFSEDADVQIIEYAQDKRTSMFTVLYKQRDEQISFILNLPGQHNVLNATAACVVAMEEGVAIEAIQQAFTQFSGVGRRMQITENHNWQQRSITVIDDYGHHPQEIRATLAAIRGAWPEKRIVMVFQPHRYSRTQDLFDDFVAVLSTVDVLVLLDVYSAGEELIPGADGRALSGSIRRFGQLDPIFVPEKQELSNVLDTVLIDGDILVFQGAGDVGRLAAQMLQVPLL
ncbi:MAG: UDP-N-acetylmuramate--L-alanine ligase [Gammaproteobacteria bacterium]